MCGIAGILADNDREWEARVGAMIGAQRHRGPDDGGVWSDGRCALGHRRLAVIDLSEAGRQPLSNEDGSVRITFNGEIYNFLALRRELEGLGHRFRSRADTEVIVHAYEQWGTACVTRLRGMFAFGIWDAPRRRLYLARDRAGKKPLFYTQHGGCFRFASELQGLLADPELPRAVDLAAVDAYLSWGYVPAPQSGFQDIRKLPPAHWLTVDLTPEGLVTGGEPYWRLEHLPKLRLTEDEAIEALRERLTEAVRWRRVSDVPLGAFLSGGIDSSIVVALMAAASDRPVKTFSIGFPEEAYNELAYARRVAERWGTEHHALVVGPEGGHGGPPLPELLPELARHYGEPFADSSAVPTAILSQLTRRQVTVALSGDGGDESFAGYDRYWANRMAERIRRLPGGRRVAPLLARALPVPAAPRGRFQHARRFLEQAHRPMPDRYAGWMSCLDEPARSALYTEELRAAVAGSRPRSWLASLVAAAGDLGPVDAAMAVDVRSYLPYDLLVKVDVASMMHSLEVRSPFLDHELMEFAARLPVALKLRGRNAKYLLKRAFADLLPPETLARRKMGFGVPVAAWLRGPLRGLLGETLLSARARARGYFRPEAVRRLVAEHQEQRADHSAALWSLLMLELWHRELVEGRLAARSS